MLESLFTRPAVVKVLDFLLELWELDFSMADIARETGLTWPVVAEVMPVIEKFDLVKISRTVGRAKLYKVNEGSPVIKALIAADLGISEIMNKEWAGRKHKSKKNFSAHIIKAMPKIEKRRAVKA